MELMAAVDEYIPTPEREMDKPFLMPIEDVFTITGRGTVVTGRIERGMVKVNEEIEIVGIRRTRADDVSPASRCSASCSTRARRATTSAAAAWHQARGRRARSGLLQARFDHAAHGVRGAGLHPDEGRGWPSHAVLQQLPSAVLLPDDRRDRVVHAARRHGDGDAG